ncbi:malonyl-ACP O-methyltransferase BioC [Chiayiivirga flava]|uniref:Malonyl-[acyl-carrier protein] O-methyltransferase n=1 Tax=Chiayiivirga flava TaxID=659595 RepID=A0A7W8D480_9GAMM|nr:malonyl-ACP O-methyltransferase BioC [Chiayiivirga flava]MBB5207655.1 malonyl-CoA O-methyltransferase [Chiayiivirga flava]
MPSPFDSRQIRRAFGRAASAYSATAVLQREVESRLLEQLDYAKTPPKRILDLGAGPGRASAALKQRWPKAHVIALDLALPMLVEARRHAGWWRPKFSRVNADASAVPLSDGSVDVIFSNLCMQWIPDLPALFAEWRRVLSPGGLLLCSTFGPDTLHELREAFAHADDEEHVSPFAPIQTVGDAMLAAGFRDPVLDGDTFTLTYADAMTLMRELHGIGAGNALAARRRTLTGKQRLRRAVEAYEAFRQPDTRLPATYEVIYAHAFGPEPGQPRRGGRDGEVAAVPIDRIRIRRRVG